LELTLAAGHSLAAPEFSSSHAWRGGAKKPVYPKSGGWSHPKPACSAPASSWSGDSYHPNGGSAEQLKLEVSKRFGAAASVETPDLGLSEKRPLRRYQASLLAEPHAFAAK
jgi:hypothetical protein